MADGCPLVGCPPAQEHELEENPDVRYDRSMWPAAEDEGFGTSNRHNQ